MDTSVWALAGLLDQLASLRGSCLVVDSHDGVLSWSAHLFLRSREQFRGEYTRRYGDDIQIAYAANAYEFGMMISDRFSDLKKRPSPDEIMEILGQTPPRDGVAGPYRFRSTLENDSYFEFNIGTH